MQPPSEHVHWLFATGILLLGLLLLAVAVSGAAFLIHEANPWFYARSAFVHHVCGWLLLVGALFPLGAAFKPRSLVFNAGVAVVFVAVAVALYSSRDVAPVFGHLDRSAGGAHRCGGGAPPGGSALPSPAPPRRTPTRGRPP